MVGEHQPPGGISTPRLHPSLERSEVGLGELTGILRLKAFRYVGEFRDGVFEGEGTYTYPENVGVTPTKRDASTAGRRRRRAMRWLASLHVGRHSHERRAQALL